MVGKTLRLFIKALIIGVLINLGLQYVSVTPLPYSENTVLHRQAQDQVPLDANFQTANHAEE
ncbi:MAG: hypothetical protein BroJett011_26840 [Chloroflexota bacterium]|nr:MAG: hypothetical protein BroJett011_26840 [Chloroflexota bacterium]